MQAEYGSKFSRNAYRLGIYAALISGAAIFSLPFLWMASASLKEDDEQMQREMVWIPRLPPACPQCPYIDARKGTALDAPSDVKKEAWRTLEPLAAATLMGAVSDIDAAEYGATPPETARPLLAAALWRDIGGRIPAAQFNAADLPAQIAKLATPGQTRHALDEVRRALALGSVSLRAVNESNVLLNVEDWKPAPQDHQIALIIPRQHDKRTDDELHYSFTQPGKRITFYTDLPFDKIDTLKFFSLRLQGDASWNRLWTAIEFNGKRYESISPRLVSEKRYGEVFFQLPSADDDNDMLIHDWIPTREASAGPAYNEQGRVRLFVSLENTSAWTKAYDKATANYRHALNYIPFWRYLLTSLFLVAINIVLNIFSSSLVAYSFARLNWPGRKYCWALLLATVMIPGQVTMIPSFLIFKWLGWFNTLRPLWIGSAFGSVFFIFMLREFMKGIPKDLEDSAKIDGCSYWQIYWHVILPLVRPTLAAIGIFTFMGTWNDFMGPLMYLSDQRQYPLSLGLFAFQTLAGGNQGMMMAASLLMTLPVIALFFVAQRHFIQGVTFSGIKG